MRKYVCSAFCILICVSLLCGCLPSPTQSQSQTFTSVSQATNDSLTPQENTEKTVNVTLPQSMAAFGTLLEQLGEEDGIKIVVKTIEGSGYALATKATMVTDNAPDIFWVENNDDAQAIGGIDALASIDEDTVSPLLVGVAELIPQAEYILDDDEVYGLSLGAVAEGYLVNIEVLAALLGADNANILLQDLENCSFEQFEFMIKGLELYLTQPGRMRLPIGSNQYQTPDYRPTVAQPSRGVFAVADGEGENLMQEVLPATLHIAGEMVKDETELTTKQEVIDEALISLLTIMDMETMHMGRSEGAMWRGEDYVSLDIANSNEDAIEQFAQGASLFLRTDTRTGFQLEEEYPHLKDKLALVPIKFPLPYDDEDEELAEEDVSEDEDDEKTEEELEEEERIAAEAEEKQQVFEMYSTQFWPSNGGYLCLSEQGTQNTAAQNLLLRLFTTQQGIDGIKETLYLQPFVDIYPNTLLSNQVMEIHTNEEAAREFQNSDTLQRAQEDIGDYIITELMGKIEWDEEDYDDFIAMASAEVGILVDVGAEEE